MADEKRLIDANALLEDFGEEPLAWNDGEAEIQEQNDWRRFKACVEAQDTIDAVEVVHGEWGEIYTCHGERLWGYKCSRCEQDSAKKSNYCPNCGAKMNGVNKDG